MKLILTTLFISFACMSCGVKKGILKAENEDSHFEHVVYSMENKILLKYNLAIETDSLINDRNGIAIVRYDYTSNGQLEQIAFLDKDSSYCTPAYALLEYDSKGRIESKQHYDKDGGEIESKILIYYNSKNEIEKIVEPNSFDRSYWSETPMSKFTYDDKGRIVKEEFFNSKGETAIIGDQGIKFITYHFNSNDQLSEEIYHYTWVLNADKEVKYKWINEYKYNSNGDLISSRYKFRDTSEEFDGQYYYNYDKKKGIYGKSEDSTAIYLTQRYAKIDDVLVKELSSDKYPRKFFEYFFVN